jgi:hypothetical protein
MGVAHYNPNIVHDFLIFIAKDVGLCVSIEQTIIFLSPLVFVSMGQYCVHYKVYTLIHVIMLMSFKWIWFHELLFHREWSLQLQFTQNVGYSTNGTLRIYFSFLLFKYLGVYTSKLMIFCYQCISMMWLVKC